MKVTSIASIFSIFSYAFTTSIPKQRDAGPAIHAGYHSLEQRNTDAGQTIDISYASEEIGLRAPLTDHFFWDQDLLAFAASTGPYTLVLDDQPPGENLKGHGEGSATVGGMPYLTVSYDDFKFLVNINEETGVMESLVVDDDDDDDVGISIQNRDTRSGVLVDPTINIR